MKNTQAPLSTLTMQGARRLAYAAAALSVLACTTAMAQGSLQPGIYGRIEFGTAPPPPVIYAQPVIIQRPAVVVQQQPLYLHVPPGHAKKWSKHCAQYNACGQPVYFVKVKGDEQFEREQQHGKHKDKDKGKHKGKGHGNGH